MCTNSNTPYLFSEEFKKLNEAKNVDDLCNSIMQQCVVKRRPYNDNNFPSAQKSLYYDYTNSCHDLRTVRWSPLRNTRVSYRSGRLCWSLFGSVLDPKDVCQGHLNDCWLLAPLASLAGGRPDLIHALFNPQELNLWGVYQIRLCIDGNWKSLLINDKVPCDQQGFPLHAQGEFKHLYAPLIEKAMAKINGCYESLDYGECMEGFSILTGAVCEELFLPPPSQSLNELELDSIWQQFTSFRDSSFLMCAETWPKYLDKSEFAKVQLMSNHAYSVLEITECQQHRLLKLRNPTGEPTWRGNFSYSSSSWTPELRDKLGSGTTTDGSFWICLADFLRYFCLMTICKVRRNWAKVQVSGSLHPFIKEDRVNCYEFVIDKPTKIDLLLYQEQQRYVPTSKRSLLYLRLGILKKATYASSYKVVCCNTWRKALFVGYCLNLQPGKYAVIPMAAMSFLRKPEDANTNRKYTLAVHSSKPLRTEHMGPVEMSGTLSSLMHEVIDKHLYLPGKT